MNNSRLNLIIGLLMLGCLALALAFPFIATVIAELKNAGL
jgi:hypothetical protein